MPTWDVKTLISVGSLLMAAAAFWRTGRVRTVDLRTKVRKDVAELRITLDDLSSKIPYRIQSRERAWSSMGLSNSGAMQEFRESANRHIDEVRGLLSRLDEIQKMPLLTTYRNAEDKSVDVEGIRTCTKQLLDKFAAAAKEDEAIREHNRKAMLERAARS
jgi:hypothetical protein